MLKQIKLDVIFKASLYIMLGIVALVVPETMEKTLANLCGVVLIIAGIMSMVYYLFKDAYANYYRNDFLYGMITTLGGILVLLKIDFVIGEITLILSVLVLISGLSKIQDLVDALRLKFGNVFALVIVALINILIGIILLVSPFKTIAMLFKVLGGGLIFSGVSDIIINIYLATKMWKYEKSKMISGDELEENYTDEIDTSNDEYIAEHKQIENWDE